MAFGVQGQKLRLSLIIKKLDQFAGEHDLVHTWPKVHFLIK